MASCLRPQRAHSSLRLPHALGTVPNARAIANDDYSAVRNSKVAPRCCRLELVINRVDGSPRLHTRGSASCTHIDMLGVSFHAFVNVSHFRSATGACGGLDCCGAKFRLVYRFGDQLPDGSAVCALKFCAAKNAQRIAQSQTRGQKCSWFDPYPLRRGLVGCTAN